MIIVIVIIILITIIVIIIIIIHHWTEPTNYTVEWCLYTPQFLCGILFNICSFEPLTMCYVNCYRCIRCIKLVWWTLILTSSTSGMFLRASQRKNFVDLSSLPATRNAYRRRVLAEMEEQKPLMFHHIQWKLHLQMERVLLFSVSCPSH